MSGRYESSALTQRILSPVGMRDILRLTAYFSMRRLFGPDWNRFPLFPQVPEPADLAEGLAGDELGSHPELVTIDGAKHRGTHRAIWFR